MEKVIMTVESKMEQANSEYHKWIREWDWILGSIQTCRLSWQNIIEIKKRIGIVT